MHDFRRLKVWQKSYRLALLVYRIADRFPNEEKYGLTSQVKRACSSISANIAEGCGRGSDTDMARFLEIAGGSACELESHLLLAHGLGYLDKAVLTEITQKTSEIKRMLESLANRLRASKFQPAVHLDT